jgi:hypothetical protein
MKHYFLIFSFVLFTISCSSPQKQDPSLIGTWKLIEEDGKEIPLGPGIQFSPDYQYFNIDSQGRPITKFRPKYWELSNDTLVMMDSNFEPQVLESRGTWRYVVEELNDKELRMRLFNKDKSSVVVYQRQ